MHRLAIITTHPIQYNAPLFSLLAAQEVIALKVFYTWGDAVQSRLYDPGFAQNIAWDTDLLAGYDYSFVKNVSKKPGSKSYKGIDNPELINEIKVWKASAILVYGWKFKSHLRTIRYFKNKIPVLFRGDSTLLDNNNNLKSLVRRLLLKKIYKNIDIALYTGVQNKKYFSWVGLKEAQLKFAPHAIDLNHFNHDEMGAASLRKNLGIPPLALVFLFAGKFEAKKNPALLLHAFLKIKTHRTHLILAGSGFLHEELESVSKGHLNVHILPFQNQSAMPALYSAANVFVLPSSGPGETWGLAINEAMACGCAVIASDKCGCAVDLVHRENGFIFKHNDENDLVEKLNFFICEQEMAMKMGIEGLKIIQNFSFEKTVSTVVKTLNNA